jgi:hypothetical protein
MRQRAINASWWGGQRGWRVGSSFRTSADYGEVWVVNLPMNLSKAQIKWLENSGLLNDIAGTDELFRQQWSQSTIILDDHRDVESFPYLEQKARALGLELVFRKKESMG